MEYMASIELALKNERTEKEFYLNEASRSRNPLARAMFEALARDEDEHIERIERLHGRLVSEGSWPQDVQLKVGETEVKKVLDEMVGKVGSSRDHNDDDEAALKKAIEFEAKGSALYSELAKASEGPAEKSFFEFLSRIEREHQLSLTDSLAYLEDPEAWMMQNSRAGLDGA